MQYSERNIWLDFIRGSAAILVCACHLRNALFIDYIDLIKPNIYLKIFYFLTSLGHQAVIIFFVLSGFFVGGSILKNIKKFNFGYYIINRLVRLWIVLIPMLFLTAAVDYIFIKYAPEILIGDLSSSINSFPEKNTYSGSFKTFVGNIFFLQNIFTPIFGINGPLWSLSNEFWYYITFPLVLLIVGKFEKYSHIFLRITGIVILLAILAILPINYYQGFIIWLFGTYIFHLKKISIKNLYSIIFVILFFLGLFLSKSNIICNEFLKDLIFGIGCTGLIFTANSWPELKPGKINKFISDKTIKISEFSYSLYLSHFPVVAMISVFLFSHQKIPPSVLNITYFILLMIILLIIGFIVYSMTEKHTERIKKLIFKLINKPINQF